MVSTFFVTKTVKIFKEEVRVKHIRAAKVLRQTELSSGNLRKMARRHKAKELWQVGVNSIQFNLICSRKQMK